jgi:hypothetical protein
VTAARLGRLIYPSAPKAFVSPRVGSLGRGASFVEHDGLARDQGGFRAGLIAARRSHRCAIVRAMPRDGSLVLSDVRAPTLTIVCEPCGRRGRYNVERLIAKHGDASPKARSASIYDRCRAVYEGLAVTLATVPESASGGRELPLAPARQ